MIDYLQLLLGYSITGDVGAQILPFLWGTGKNGKSVLLDVMMKLLGDYADAAPPPGFLMAKRSKATPPTSPNSTAGASTSARRSSPATSSTKRGSSC